ncbi:unnamed protein product, partial [marine sediment metagenome]
NVMKLFYIQDTRSYVGNSMLWWEENNSGYVCDIRKAKVFTEEEAKKICPGRGRYYRSSQNGKRMWPKEYIDQRISQHIDMQHCELFVP